MRALAWVCVGVLAAAFGASAQGDSSAETALFEEVAIDFQHRWNRSTHPFLGASVIDVDGDGCFEIFVGGGEGDPDALFAHRGGVFENVIEGTGLSDRTATYGSKAIDLDDDGDTDLIVARDDGLHLYLNRGGSFEHRSIPVELPPESAPLDVAVADIDRDGDADLYVSVFVAFPHFMSATFNDPSHAKTNRLLLNRGDLSFVDVTESSGTAGLANTFCSLFVDLDLDGWQDLVLAQNTGEVEILHNQRDGTFAPVATGSGYGFWMGIGVADVDSDGDQDLFFPNVGGSIPRLLTRGDIRSDQRHTHNWLLLRNDGDMRFRDVTDSAGLGDEGFAWGGVFEDVDLDGRMDLFVAQNYIKWPFHRLFKLKGRAFLQGKGALGFRPAPELGLANPHFGQSSLVVDFDGDGYQDFLWLNMDGPLRAFRHAARGRFLTVALADAARNLGARIAVTTSQGRLYTRELVAGEGFLTDSTPERSFGLGDAEPVSVRVLWPDGHEQRYEHLAANTRLVVVREEATGSL